jgi:hypothetical protein
MDETVPPPSTFAFSWLSGLLRYDTPVDGGHAAIDTWLLTHPDLRLKAALGAGMTLEKSPVRELVEDGVSVDGAIWTHSVGGLMAHMRGLLPDGLTGGRRFTALRHAFPESPDRQTVVFIAGVRGEIPAIGTQPFGLTVVRHPRAWRVVYVQREWMMPEWFLDADDELPSGDPL